MPRTTPRPIDRHPPGGTYYPLLDVDHEGVTSDGETFDHRATDRALYEGTASESLVILRHPCGRLEMTVRVWVKDAKV